MKYNHKFLHLFFMLAFLIIANTAYYADSNCKKCCNDNQSMGSDCNKNDTSKTSDIKCIKGLLCGKCSSYSQAAIFEQVKPLHFKVVFQNKISKQLHIPNFPLSSLERPPKLS